MVAAQVRTVELLVGIRGIARFLRVSNRKVQKLAGQGAPVSKDVKGVMRAEKKELWDWWRGNGSREGRSKESAGQGGL